MVGAENALSCAYAPGCVEPPVRIELTTARLQGNFALSVAVHARPTWESCVGKYVHVSPSPAEEVGLTCDTAVTPNGEPSALKVSFARRGMLPGCRADCHAAYRRHQRCLAP